MRTQDEDDAADGAVNPALETRYRRLLRVLPRGYRALREQEMVDIFLESELDDEDPEVIDLTARYGRPSTREAISVLVLAARLRWAGVDAPQRAQERARALRFAVIAGLVVLAVAAVHVVLANIWFAAVHPEDRATESAGTTTIGDVIATVYSWSFLLWLIGFVAVLCGRPRWAQAACIVPLISGIAAAAAFPWMVGYWAAVLMQAALVVGLTGVETRQPDPARRVWIVGFCGGTLILVAAMLAADVFLNAFAIMLLDEAGLWSLAALAGGMALLVLRARGRQVTTGQLLGTAALAGAAMIVTAGKLIDLARLLPSEDVVADRIVLAAAIQLIVAAAVGVVTGALGIHRFRQLPPMRYDAVVGVRDVGDAASFVRIDRPGPTVHRSE